MNIVNISRNPLRLILLIPVVVFGLASILATIGGGNGDDPRDRAPITGVRGTSCDGQNFIGWDNYYNTIERVSATWYDIFWSTSSPVTKSSDRIRFVTSPHIHGGLANGVTYYYRVIGGASNWDTKLSDEISLTPADGIPCGYTVGLTVTDKAGFGALQLNNSSGFGAIDEDMSVYTNGPYTFATPLADGADYAVTVVDHPTGQTCAVTGGGNGDGSGAISGANVTDIQVICSAIPTPYTVNGSVTGLTGTGLVLNNGADNLPIAMDGAFTFPTGLADGANYQVTVVAHPTDQTCSVTGGANGIGGGIISGADVTDILVTCTAGAPPTMIRVSIATDGSQGDGASFATSISENGRYIAFESEASNLVADDTNGTGDIFVHDTLTGETTRLSIADDGSGAVLASAAPSIEYLGSSVAFESHAFNLVAGDTNNSRDIFVHSRTTVRVSLPNLADQGVLGMQANGDSYHPAIQGSFVGKSVAFASDATNLVVGDTNGVGDIFVHDQSQGETIRVSVASDGTQADGNSFRPAIGGTFGNKVAFESSASNLASFDPNGAIQDVFVHDIRENETLLVSDPIDIAGADGISRDASISEDGRYVAFVSDATNLVANDTNGVADIFVRDMQSKEITRVSVPNLADQGTLGTQAFGFSYAPSISGGGRYVAFESEAGNLVVGDTNPYKDIFVHDRRTGRTMRVSVADDGTQADAWSWGAQISRDRMYVTFVSAASNLVANDTNGWSDVFRVPNLLLTTP